MILVSAVRTNSLGDSSSSKSSGWSVFGSALASQLVKVVSGGVGE